jgi:hypothetical protein
VSRIACRSPGSPRSTREEATNARALVGSWGGPRSGLAPLVTMTAPKDTAAAGGRSSSVSECMRRLRFPRLFLNELDQQPTPPNNYVT